MSLFACDSHGERLLSHLAGAWFGPAAAPWVRKVIRYGSWCIGVSSLGYLLCILVMLILFRWVGERWWLLWLPLFMPPHLTLLPLTILFPLGLAFNLRSLAVSGVILIVIVFGYMGLRFPVTSPPTGTPQLVVMTSNRGNRNKARLTPFIEAESPDIIAVQDASRRERKYARQYPDCHVRGHGEFVLISRLPIASSGLVDEVLWRNKHPVAARFELEWGDRRLVVYNVHMPTPRWELGRLMGRGLLKEWAKYRGWFGRDPADSVIPSLQERPRLVHGLLGEIKKEQSPVIIAGDLNMASWGYTYSSLTVTLTDAFGERGQGTGFTFPGVTRNPLTGFGPWLRLDYILCDDALRPYYAKTEPASRAQHRAVVAGLVLKNGF